MTAYPLPTMRDEIPPDPFREFVASMAELTTDEEMGGDMSGDDAASELSGWIETARALVRDEKNGAT